MHILSFTVGPFAENTYLIIESGKALLIDPGFSTHTEFTSLKTSLSSEKADLIGVLLTHAHIDHLLGLNQVLQTYDVPVWLNHSDLTLWENVESQSAMFGVTATGFSFTPEPLDEQKDFTVGPFTMDVLYTPGHSPDHVSLYLSANSTVIAGDALFRESIGRTDLYQGDYDLLAASIRNKLYTLPDETEVLPGHGPATTVGHEKKMNGFVKF